MPVYAVEQKEHTLDTTARNQQQLKQTQQIINETSRISQQQQSITKQSSVDDVVVDEEDQVEEEVQPVDDVIASTTSTSSTSSSASTSTTNAFEDDETMAASNNNNTTSSDDKQVEAAVPSSSSAVTSPTNSTSPVEVTDNACEVSKEDPVEHNIIIFDWDDTLLASSFLASNGYRLDLDIETCENYSFVQNELQMLESCVVNILEEALQRGKVHIITNAENGWVEMSARKFLPAVLPYLNRVQVLSARSTYEHLFPDSPMKWKYCAMQERLSPVISHETSRKNIISFGDSYVEREAVRAVTRGAANTRTKSIKFAECPNTEQLRKQLELVANCFHYIFTHDGDLDLMLKMSMVPAANNAATNNNNNTSPAPTTTNNNGTATANA